MKMKRLIALMAVLLLLLSGCQDNKASPQPSTSPTVQVELSPLPPHTLPSVAEATLPTETPVPSTVDTVVPTPNNNISPSISMREILCGEKIASFSQSSEVCGAVTQDGRLLVWGGIDPSPFSLYSDTGAEAVYNTGLTGIVEAWLADSHIGHNFALDKDGQLWGFGANVRGLMLTQEVWPEGMVPVMDHVTSFTRGRRNNAWAAAVKEDGSVWFWAWSGEFDPDTQTYPATIPAQIANNAISVMHTAADHLHIVTKDGHLLDLGSGEDIFNGIVTNVLIKENTLWADGGYALGADKKLYRMGTDGDWKLVKENVKQVDCSRSTAFFLTESGELYTWERQLGNQGDWVDTEKDDYRRIMDNVVAAAPLELGVTVCLKNNTVAEISLD